MLDLNTWESHRALNNHEAVSQKTWDPVVINGTKVEVPWKIGVDTIALSPKGGFNLTTFSIIHSGNQRLPIMTIE